MAYTYCFLLKAQEEYEAAIEWYLEHSYDAALNFINAVDDCLELICNHPYRWRNPYSIYRELNVQKFPYTIVYFIEKDSPVLMITAVHHHKRSTENKYGEA